MSTVPAMVNHQEMVFVAPRMARRVVRPSRMSKVFLRRRAAFAHARRNSCLAVARVNGVETSRSESCVSGVSELMVYPLSETTVIVSGN